MYLERRIMLGMGIFLLTEHINFPSFFETNSALVFNKSKMALLTVQMLIGS